MENDDIYQSLLKEVKDIIEEMRKITLHKFDVISTYVFTYIENYTKYTEEEKRIERENRVGNA